MHTAQAPVQGLVSNERFSTMPPVAGSAPWRRRTAPRQRIAAPVDTWARAAATLAAGGAWASGAAGHPQTPGMQAQRQASPPASRRTPAETAQRPSSGDLAQLGAASRLAQPEVESTLPPYLLQSAWPMYPHTWVALEQKHSSTECLCLLQLLPLWRMEGMQQLWLVAIQQGTHLVHKSSIKTWPMCADLNFTM